MFTGIIEELGTLIARDSEGSAVRLHFSAQKVLSDLKVDDSISVDGVCQTVVARGASSFEVISVPETLKKTTLSSLKIGEKVNLERAATLETRLGGHLVQGHIDGVAKLNGIKDLGGSWEYSFSLPHEFMRFISPQGSITINGVSLTVAGIADDTIRIAIIPHTYEMTTFQYLQESEFVNIELDCVAKMIDRLIEGRPSKS